MQSPTRILLPLDFSERSAGAVRYGRVLASQFGAELILLHVVTPPQLEFGAVEIGGSRLGDLYRDQVGAAGRALESFHAEELSGLNVRRTVLEGDPARRIVEFSHERAADLIVMPTHGYGTFRRFILGSNTAKVLHDADCPVWTGVHLDETQVEPVPQIKTVLCGVDLGSQSSKALCWAALFAQSFGARLVLLHVTAPDPDLGDDSEVNWHVDVREAAEEELLRLQRFVGAAADLEIDSGEPAAALCSMAARVKADVVVIGRGSAAGVFGRLRTNAYAIIRQSPCPVVSV